MSGVLIQERSRELNFEIYDGPFQCCGLTIGEGFSNAMPTGAKRTRFGVLMDEFRGPEEKDIRARLEAVLAAADDQGRNCAMVVLASTQVHEMRIAEELGFQKVYTFFNPNSGHNVHFYTKVQWENREEYRAAMGGDSDDEDYE